MNSLIATDNYVIIVGTGATGQSVARYLSKKGTRFSFFDTRATPPDMASCLSAFPDAPVYLETIDHSILLGAQEIVISPGVSRQQPDIGLAISHGIPVVGDVSLFLRENSAKVVGITGSNGKTTVTTMLGLAAKADDVSVAVGGNIGTPALDLLEQNPDLVILELSSFQLESIASPALDVACVLNVSEDHMDRYPSFAHYAMTKQRIYFAAKNVVYNLDDIVTIPPAVEKTARIGFGLSAGKEEYEKKYTLDTVDGVIRVGGKIGGQVLIERKDIKLQGGHNLLNACALFALADAANISEHAVISVLTTFVGLPHRCEWIAEKKGVCFVNDSKATNVGATKAALNGFVDYRGALILIAGGDSKEASFDALADTINASVKHTVLIGRDATLIANALADSTAFSYADSMSAAVDTAFAHAEQGDLVLLSPACASFDMFDGYAHRGDAFRAAVAGLAS